ncbi:MAG: serine/threonine protein kinase [Akkermansia sp.]|nr:serine/threonine protein kinase [Akkermansia sp.]
MLPWVTDEPTMASDYSKTGNREITIALPAGFTLGNYRILRSIGQGGFGITYLAQHIPSGQQVVIKENMPAAFSHRSESTLHVSPTGGGEVEDLFNWSLDRFLKEAATLTRLHHPNIVKVGESFTALGTAYYVMEYIDGAELHKAAPPPDKINEAWLRPILCKLLEALDHIHSCELLHRDIKPNNILLDKRGEPTLIDFGTARSLISERSATMIESPGYSPLEQLQKHSKKGPWIDIYSLGSTMYRLLTGQNPPRSIDRLTDADPCIPLALDSSLLQRFSRQFLSSIDKAMAMRYTMRWQTAQEWLEELQPPSFFFTVGTPAPTAPPLLPDLPKLPAPVAKKKKHQEWTGSIGDWWVFMLLIFVGIGISVVVDSGFLCFITTLSLYLWACLRRAGYLGISLSWALGWPVTSMLMLGVLAITGMNDDFIMAIWLIFLFVIPGCIYGRIKSKG